MTNAIESVTDGRRLQLETDILQAFDNYMGERVSGPWEELARWLADVVHRGALTLAEASAIETLLSGTR